MGFRISRHPENRGRIEYDEISGPNRMRVLSKHKIRVDNNLAFQENDAGDVVSHINLNSRFDICIPYEGNGRGIYRVAQGHQVLEFSSESADAQRIAVEVFGFKKWPPDRYINPP